MLQRNKLLVDMALPSGEASNPQPAISTAHLNLRVVEINELFSLWETYANAAELFRIPAGREAVPPGFHRVHELRRNNSCLK
jgi:hypothetical protein